MGRMLFGGSWEGFGLIETRSDGSLGGGGGGGGSGGDGDSFVSRISEYFMRWKVRPDVVLRGRHENKSKGALSAFWQASVKTNKASIRFFGVGG